MNPSFTRKTFLVQSAMAAAAALAAPRLLGQSPTVPPVSTAPDRGPQIEAARIREFVIAGHGKLDVVKEMLTAQPALVNATWDWGGGDFETALGGASHMGQVQIAELLLASGARMDLFAAAMLGKLDIIKAAVAAFPEIVHVPGPHKIPLIAHAEKSGATAVVDFLRPLVGKRE